MKMAEVKTKAKDTGVKPGKKNKISLVREIQTMEGNSPCFCSEIANICSISDCYWKQDCVANN